MTKRTKCKLCGEWVAGIEQGPMPPDLDIEVEVSGMPKPKHTRMTTLKVESRGRAKFESGPLDFYANVQRAVMPTYEWYEIVQETFRPR